MAMIIDTAGNLAALNKRTTKGLKQGTSIVWLGVDYDEDTE